MKKQTLYLATTYPIQEREINTDEAPAYLNCKFWKQSKEEALLFLCLYLPLHYENRYLGSVKRAIGLITGELFNYQNPEDFLNQQDFTPHNFIMGKMGDKESYPKFPLIDDTILWGKQNELVKPDVFSKIQSQVESVRKRVFNTSPSENIRKAILQEILTLDFVYYEDVKEILNISLTIEHFFELIAKTSFQDKYLISRHSANKKHYYFKPESLIKWLIKLEYFPKSWINSYSNLKIESIKESIHENPKTFSLKQLEAWLEKKHPENCDVFYHVTNNIYGIYLSVLNPDSWSYAQFITPNQTPNKTYKNRFAYLERLLASNHEHHNLINNLLRGSTINFTANMMYVPIESTYDELIYGLARRYMFKDNSSHEFFTENIRFVVEEVKNGMCKYSEKKHHKNNKEKGRLSGLSRKAEADSKWQALKPLLLNIAKKTPGKSANWVAKKAVKDQIISDKQLSNTRKRISADRDFKPFIKLRK